MIRSSLTEETPATPGWVEERARAVFAELAPGHEAVCATYLDCLAGVRGAEDVEAGHDRCRRAALLEIEDEAQRDALSHALLALEAELARDT